ncbi:Linear gramicidin synthase subunit D [Dolichospermum sp. UHCC 0315A]|nr:non-ribosomal peptide synthetase [Dolichospermum sp. UHCC 0315A]QEI42775.1 Linear gramicidin synthase subunit D [Dolichospermum sp. UHCC 0315A]
MDVIETHLVSIDYQIRQLREIQPVTTLFNIGIQNKIEKQDKIIDTISIELRDKIYNLTTNSPVNNLALYLSVIKFLIFKYTAQEQFIVATGALNLDKSNSLIFSRFDKQKLISFKDLLKITRSNLQEGYRYQNYDVDSLVETFIARGGNPAAVFDIALIHKGLCSHSSLLNNFQLVFEIDAQDTSVSVTFPKDAFSADFVQRMLAHFRQIIETVTVNPDCKLSEIDILTTEERKQLIRKWNNTEIQYSQKCIHQLFEEQVERSPDAIAVVFDNQQLTYRHLNERANQLAHYLQKLGVKPELLVGICIERSLEMIVGLLGILKAGGAYVPLDPSYPKERLSYMLEDTGVKVLLTQRSLTELLPENQAIVVSLDGDWQVIAQENQNNLNSGVKGENLAYVIYTSGSTGKPKGAMNTHKGISNRLVWMQNTYQLTSSDRILQKTPFSFDVSVWEFFWPLLAGATLVVVKPQGHKDNAYLIKLIQQQQITTIHFVPSMLRVFLQEPSLENCSCLKRVICSGEALPYELTQRFFERLNCELHNLYGPTEAAIDVTFWHCLPQIQQQIVPIGRPIANTQIYILDQYLQPVPVGIAGELHIGGVGLARGYLNRPELTSHKFISHSFGDGKLYKTGDLARYLPDGNIEFLGRIDHQVKIRGFRIELGEIETVLSHHPAVEQAIVIAHEDETGHKSLIAYIVGNSQPSDAVEHNQEVNLFDEQILQSYLESRLPEYMMPNAFVMLDAIPLTANGKIDRRALPSLEQIRIELANTYVAPCTPIEEILAVIWAEVLGIEQVGIHDNFFELGGDSIRGIQVIAKAKQIGFDFSLPQLLQYQTIQELAGLVSRELGFLPTPKTEAFSLISDEQRLNLPEDIEDAYPLAALQAGMIFHSEYSNDVSIYHDVFTYYIRATLDPQALHSAIQQVVNRHPVLRTSFVLTDYKQPLQLVHQQVDVPLKVDDLSHLSTTEQEVSLDAWIEQEKKRHFDWGVPPLLRFYVHRRTSETFNLTLSFHHSILDGWSEASLLTELLQQYLYLLGKDVLPLSAPPTITFRDFVALEQTTLHTQECQKYWQKQLSDIIITKLPRWSKSNAATKNCDLPVSISSRVSQGLKQLSKATGIPLKSVLLAAHLRVLSLLTNQTDIITGLVSNGRLEDTDGEKVLGLFLNTLPLRLKLLGGSWIDLVRQTFDAERECLPWRRYPLAKLQRTFGGQPLFETAFNFVHFHVYQSIIGVKDLEVLDGKFFNQTNLALLANFSLHPISYKVEFILKYDPSQFCKEQMKMIGGYYQEALTAMANQWSELYEKHCLLSDKEQYQLLVEWNNTKANYPQDKCIHQLFEEQVERSPNAVAVVFENQQLTYQELNEQANQLAHYLQTKGVKPEVLVGICLERSPQMVVGLLGILKAGGAYVPLDPTYPTQRLEMILADSQVSVLLTQQKLVARLPENKAGMVILNTDDADISLKNKKNPISQVNSRNSAYVIYTSGSTGKPKGVVIEHHSTITLLCWAKQVFTTDELAGVLASTSICFDLSVFELFVPLAWGGKVILAQNALDLPSLQAQEVTLINTVPTAIAQLLQIKGIPNCVQTINLAGEPLSNQLAQQLYQQENIQRVYNLYGPSEDTTYSTFSLVQKGAIKQPSIGRPISNTQIYIFNPDLQPVPIGIVGELYIGGEGLARGYLNQPELTSQKFIANPFDNSQKLYKTGDLARYLPDGNIEFLGRIDNQVKLRGFRIELGEVESVLETYPQIQQAVVMLREDTPGNKRLVAYLVTQNQSINMSDLRRFLQQKLPDYIIPSSFVILSTLPLTPNGKVDRKMLPVPEAELTREQEFVPPQTPVEQILATIWQDVLGIKQVSRYDKFFEVGGDSILSIQVVGRARQAGIKITPRQIFQYSTLAELAAVADTCTLMLVQQGLVTGFVPLTPIQHWFFEQNRSEPHHFNQSVLLQIPSDLKPELLSQAIGKLLEHHDALRLRFSFEEGEWQQINYGISDEVPFQVIDLSQTPQSQLPQTLEQIATIQQARLNLSDGPLMRVVLFQLGNNQDSRLLIVIHHLAVDGVSWRILLEDLFTVYQQLKQQETIQLPPKTLAFKEWAMLLQEYGQAEAVQSQLHYWLKQPWSEVNSLPVDDPTGKQNNSVASAANVFVTLSQEQTCALLQQVPSAYNTQINEVLLTALVQTLAKWTGNSTVLIDLEGHGREDIFADVDVSRTVGWFTSIFPVILQLQNQNHLGEALKSIKEQLRAIPQQGISYGILRYLSQNQEISFQIAALPFREVSFNYLGQFDQGQLRGIDWKLASESKGANQSLEGHRTHLLEITARVVEGQLQINWSYSRHLHRHSTVESLVQKYLQALLKLIDHCLSPEVGGYTPSDFPVANLNQQELDEILAEID